MNTAPLLAPLSQALAFRSGMLLGVRAGAPRLCSSAWASKYQRRYVYAVLDSHWLTLLRYGSATSAFAATETFHALRSGAAPGIRPRVGAWR
jgi:hypothetical protein